MKPKVIKYLLILAIFVSVASIPLLNPKLFTEKFNPEYYSKLWSGSQYVKGEASPRGISDGEAYTYAAWHYIRGGDPSTVNFEHPPLGKYLTGLSLLLFNNPVVINFPLGIFALLATFILALTVTKNKTVSLFASLLLSLDPLFRFNITSVLLDLPAMLFLLMTLIGVMKAKDNPKWYLVTSLSIGLLISTKWYLNTLIIFAAILGWLLFSQGKKATISFLKTLPLAAIVYVASYSAYFYYHPSLIEFIKYQKWVTVWWFGTPRVPGNMLAGIFTGKMMTWFGDKTYLPIDQWSLLHPVALVMSLLALRSNNKNMLLLILVSITFLIYASLGTGIYRYLLMVLPLLYIVSVQTIAYIIKNLRHNP